MASVFVYGSIAITADALTNCQAWNGACISSLQKTIKFDVANKRLRLFNMAVGQKRR